MAVALISSVVVVAGVRRSLVRRKNSKNGSLNSDMRLWRGVAKLLIHFYMDLGYKNCYVGIMHMEYEGIQFYFIDNEYYFQWTEAI